MKTLFNFIFLFLMGLPSIFSQWVQIGDDIYGDAWNDNLEITDLSGDGTILALGAPSGDINGTSAGYVEVLNQVDGNWIQLGSKIVGKNSGDFLGRNLSLSADGLTIAVSANGNDDNGPWAGQVSVFQFNSGEWIQVGEDVNGSEGDGFGTEVQLSSNGTILAASASFAGLNGEDSGYVKVFSFDGSNWVQLGNTLIGEQAGDYFGQKIALSGNGSTLAVVAPDNDDAGYNAGYVKVYRLQNNIWQQVGQTIFGQSNDSPNSVSLSEDGTVLAIGRSTSNEGGFNTGLVQVFKNTGNSWTQLGNILIGETEGERFGFRIDLSGDGSIIAIGAPFNSENFLRSGATRIYKLVDDYWEQVGSEILGTAIYNYSGRSSVSISGDGSTVAIPSDTHQEIGTSNGRVRVYKYSPTSASSSYFDKKPKIVLFPNPASNTVTVLLEALGQKSGTLVISDQLGRTVLIQKLQAGQEVLDLDLAKNGMNTGVYQVTVTTETQRLVKRLMVNR